MDPVLGVPGIAIDVAGRVDPPNRAISGRANICKGTRDLDPGFVVIACVTIDVTTSVDPPDIGDRSSRDAFERTGDLFPSSHRDKLDKQKPQHREGATIFSTIYLMKQRLDGCKRRIFMSRIAHVP